MFRNPYIFIAFLLLLVFFPPSAKATGTCESAFSTSEVTVPQLFNEPQSVTALDNFVSRCNGEKFNNFYVNVVKLGDIPEEEGLNITFASGSYIHLTKVCVDALKSAYSLGNTPYVIAIEQKLNKIFNERNYINKIKYEFLKSGDRTVAFTNVNSVTACSKSPIIVNYAVDIKNRQQDKFIFSEKIMDVEERTELLDQKHVIVNLTKVLYAKNEYNIDLFNQTDEFFSSLCIKFKSEAGADVPLNRRNSDYKVNLETCSLYGDESVYTGFSYELNDKEEIDKLFISCAFGSFNSEEEKATYLKTMDQIDGTINKVFKNSNFKVVQCTSDVFAFNLENIMKNYGELVCSGILVVQGLLLLFYFCIGTTPIKKEVEKFLDVAEYGEKEENASKIEDDLPPQEAPTPINFEPSTHKSICVNNQKLVKTGGVNSRKSAFLPQMQGYGLNSENETNLIKSKEVSVKRVGTKVTRKSNQRVGLGSSIGLVSNPPKTYWKVNELEMSINIPLAHPPRPSRSSSKAVMNLVTKQKKYEDEFEGGANYQENEEVASSEKKSSDGGSVVDQIHELNDVELNALSLHNARKYDVRGCCCMYWSFLKFSQLIIFTFCNNSDYNLTIVKISLLLFIIPMQLTFNAFFYSDDDISAIYIDRENLNYSFNISNLPRAIASSVLGFIILFILKKLCLSHKGIEEIRKEKNVDVARQLTEDFICSLKCHIFIYFIISSCLLIVFWFFVSAFCYVFEGLQMILIRDTLLSFIFTLFYPFLISMGAACCRKCGICCNCGCWYCISKLLAIF